MNFLPMEQLKEVIFINNLLILIENTHQTNKTENEELKKFNTGQEEKEGSLGNSQCSREGTLGGTGGGTAKRGRNHFFFKKFFYKDESRKNSNEIEYKSESQLGTRKE